MNQKLDISYYLELQRRFEEILLFVALHEDNFGVYSIKIENLLVATCSMFDSLCQEYISELKNGGHIFSNEPSDINQKVSGGKDFNMGDYRLVLESEYLLSSYEINLNCYQDNFFGNPYYYFGGLNRSLNGYKITPFSSWSESKKPHWWSAFTLLKHNRTINFKQGTMKNLVDALAATFIVLSLKNKQTFFESTLDKEIYNVFFPCYWKYKGIDVTRGNISLGEL